LACWTQEDSTMRSGRSGARAELDRFGAALLEGHGVKLFEWLQPEARRSRRTARELTWTAGAAAALDAP